LHIVGLVSDVILHPTAAGVSVVRPSSRDRSCIDASAFSAWPRGSVLPRAITGMVHMELEWLLERAACTWHCPRCFLRAAAVLDACEEQGAEL
jgi:hypothetical protein